jgi:alginate O-acetyltransferase complex protein AlgJ
MVRKIAGTQQTQQSTTEAIASERPHPLTWLPGAFMILFLITGLVLSFLNPATFEAPQEKNIITGEWTKAYSANFEAQLPIREPAVQTWGVLAYALFGDGRRGVLIGEDGWLYTTEEFAYYRNEAAETEAKLAFVREVQKTLSEQGTQLVIALVPAKATVYEENLGRYAPPSYTAERFENFRSQLEALGIPTPDLMTVLSENKSHEDVFLRTDTHWTPYGAAVAADALAERIAQEALLPSLGNEAFETRVTGTTRFEGDLLNFIPLGPFQSRLGPQPDSLREQETVQTSEADVGLFDEVQIPVVLVGTSYSANARWNFDGALKEALGADVLNIAEEGIGPFLPMSRYLQSDAFRQHPPELVIWEIPERYIPMPYDLSGEQAEDDPYGAPPGLF